jgi:alkanesulfonate monooxygenase
MHGVHHRKSSTDHHNRVGTDPATFAAAVARQTSRIKLIVALRMGEQHPPALARAIATLDHILAGRLVINIISSDLLGTKQSAEYRYAHSGAIVDYLRQTWNLPNAEFAFGDHYFRLPSAPGKTLHQPYGPPLYFGGISDAAKDLAARIADVYLMWPETEAQLQETILDVAARAATHGRTLDFGLRIHVIVRETESEARAAATRLISKLDVPKALEDRSQHQDSHSYGVWRQDQLRLQSDPDGFIEPLVWSRIGLAFSGCGSSLVGSGPQVLDKLNRYMDLGFRAFIFSGFPLLEESQYFAEHVLAHLPSAAVGRALPLASAPVLVPN